MKYKNITDKPIMMKIGEWNDWVTLEAQKTYDIPELYGKRQEGLIPVVEEEQEKEEEIINKGTPGESDKTLNKKDLQGMTKDDINDEAAVRGYQDINSYMLKKEMIKKFLECQSK